MKRNIKILCFLLFFSFASSSSTDSFDVEMGCKTKHWAHVAKQEDIEALASFRSLFHRNGCPIFGRGLQKTLAGRSSFGPIGLARLLAKVWRPLSLKNIHFLSW